MASTSTSSFSAVISSTSYLHCQPQPLKKPVAAAVVPPVQDVDIAWFAPVPPVLASTGLVLDEEEAGQERA